jgi:glyoxylase-like metal-dependent hydrolase (beta-lactamase superfamily II)
VLVDTGVGPGPVAALGDLRGSLPAALARQGIASTEIDTVFLTHLHLDHVGWNLSEAGTPTFPNARYLVGRADWEAFSREATRLPYLATTVLPLAELGLLDMLDGETDLGAGLIAMPTPGHTPGHMSLRVAGGDAPVLIAGEVVTHPAQVTEDGWRFVADADGRQAVATRRHILDWAEATGAVLAVAHFPFPGFGRIARSGGARVWTAL